MNALAILRKEIESLRGVSAVTVARHEFLIRPGMTEQNLYLVETGAIRAFYLTEFEEHTIRFGYKDSLITSLDSFLSGDPTQLYMQAIKKTRLRVIPKNVFKEFIRENTQRQVLYQQLLEELVRQQMEREIDILTESALERYRRVLKRSPQLFQEIPARYIASYLRMTPETLSRLKKS